MKTVKFRIEKRYRWVLIPLVIGLIALVLIPQMFLVQETRKDAWTRIRSTGQLVALTDKNSLDYFLYRGEPKGYQLELLESLARYLGVSLRILASDDISHSWYYLAHHAGDLLAWNLPVSPESKYLVSFTAPFWESRYVVIQRGPKFILDPKDFSGDTVYAEKNPFLVSLVGHFTRLTHGRAIVAEKAGVGQEDLARQVSEGKIRFAICTENMAQVMKRNFRNLDTRLVISHFIRFSWGVNTDSDSLRDKVNEWLSDPGTQKEIRKIYLTYYDNPKIPGCLNSDYCSLVKNRISPYDDEIRKYSRIIGWDWRLLASLIYEESNFHSEPVSSRNAKGLMQLVPETAEKFGMDSLSGTAQQILSGVRYLKWLDRQLPPEITIPRERVCFILAAYNVGIGRVLTAREKAARFGKDPNRWNGNVDYFLTRKSKKNPYGEPESEIDLSPFGEPGSYVDKILTRYYHYRNLITP